MGSISQNSGAGESFEEYVYHQRESCWELLKRSTAGPSEEALIYLNEVRQTSPKVEINLPSRAFANIWAGALLITMMYTDHL